MLQISILRTVRVALPKLAPAAVWRECRRQLLPQVTAIVGMLALLCGLLWAAAEYADRRAELRRAETDRYLDQFRSGPVGAAWARVSAAWQAERDRQEALLARLLASSSGSERAQSIRDHRMFVLEIIEEYGLHDAIDEVSRFLARLAICVRAGSCEAMSQPRSSGPPCGRSAISTSTTSASNTPRTTSTATWRSSRRVRRDNGRSRRSLIPAFPGSLARRDRHAGFGG